MSRFWGNVGINRGFVETSPGIVEQYIDEVQVTGEMRIARLSWPKEGMRDKLSAGHVLSIITPEDSEIDFTEAVYISWKGRNWSVIGIEFKRPRVELTLGGLYNG